MIDSAATTQGRASVEMAPAPPEQGWPGDSARTALPRCPPVRWRRSLTRHLPQQRANRRGDVGRKLPISLEVGLQHRRRACRSCLRRRTGARPSASRTARTRTPRCRCACRPACPSPAPGHVRGGAENHPAPVIIAGRRDRRRHATASRRRRAGRVQSPSRARSPAPSPCRRRGP